MQHLEPKSFIVEIVEGARKHFRSSQSIFRILNQVNLVRRRGMNRLYHFSSRKCLFFIIIIISSGQYLILFFVKENASKEVNDQAIAESTKTERSGDR
jgi:hypothetical protein